MTETKARKGTVFFPSAGLRWHVAARQQVTDPRPIRPMGSCLTLCGLRTYGVFGKGGEITCGRCRRLMEKGRRR